jgi:hypothetical protein
MGVTRYTSPQVCFSHTGVSKNNKKMTDFQPCRTFNLVGLSTFLRNFNLVGFSTYMGKNLTPKLWISPVGFPRKKNRKKKKTRLTVWLLSS